MQSTEMILGARTSFGTREVEKKVPAKVIQRGQEEEIILEVNGDDLPTYLAGDETSRAFTGGEYIISWTAYSPDNTTAAVAIDLVGEDDGVTLGLSEPTLDVTSDIWARSTTAVIVPEACQIVATGPAAGEVAHVAIRYVRPLVV